MPDEVTPVAEPTPPEGGAPESTEVPVTEERPDWLDARFKTAEDQAKAYREAEKMAQQKSQRAAELERQNQELLGRITTPVAQPETNYDELFWQKPTEVMKNLIGSQVQAAVQPFIEDGYQMQKSKYANDASFKKYEPMIDQITTAQPQLKAKRGVVDELYRVARSMDPEYERSVEERIRQELQQKIGGSVEGAGTPGNIKPAQKMDLSAEEKAVAERFYGDLSPQEAHKKYYEAKTTRGGA